MLSSGHRRHQDLSMAMMMGGNAKTRRPAPSHATQEVQREHPPGKPCAFRDVPRFPGNEPAGSMRVLVLWIAQLCVTMTQDHRGVRTEFHTSPVCRTPYY